MIDGILLRVQHEIARYGAQVRKKEKKGGKADSRETKVLVKAKANVKIISSDSNNSLMSSCSKSVHVPVALFSISSL